MCSYAAAHITAVGGLSDWVGPRRSVTLVRLSPRRHQRGTDVGSHRRDADLGVLMMAGISRFAGSVIGRLVV